MMKYLAHASHTGLGFQELRYIKRVNGKSPLFNCNPSLRKATRNQDFVSDCQCIGGPWFGRRHVNQLEVREAREIHPRAVSKYGAPAQVCAPSCEMQTALDP